MNVTNVSCGDLSTSNIDEDGAEAGFALLFDIKISHEVECVEILKDFIPYFPLWLDRLIHPREWERGGDKELLDFQKKELCELVIIPSLAFEGCQKALFSLLAYFRKKLIGGLNFQLEWGDSLLHFACRIRSLELFKVLLADPLFDPRVANDDQFTSLDLILHNFENTPHKFDLEVEGAMVVLLLGDPKFNFFELDKIEGVGALQECFLWRGEHPMMEGILHLIEKICFFEPLKIIFQRSQVDLPINSVDGNENDTSSNGFENSAVAIFFHMAISHSFENIALFLLDQYNSDELKINKISFKGLTPVEISVDKCQVEIVRKIIDKFESLVDFKREIIWKGISKPSFHQGCLIDIAIDVVQDNTTLKDLSKRNIILDLLINSPYIDLNASNPRGATPLITCLTTYSGVCNQSMSVKVNPSYYQSGMERSPMLADPETFKKLLAHPRVNLNYPYRGAVLEKIHDLIFSKKEMFYDSQDKINFLKCSKLIVFRPDFKLPMGWNYSQWKGMESIVHTSPLKNYVQAMHRVVKNYDVAFLAAQLAFLFDGYLQCKEKGTSVEKRFFAIAKKLPFELCVHLSFIHSGHGLRETSYTQIQLEAAAIRREWRQMICSDAPPNIFIT